MHTQICLISKQLEPNIYSLLQFKPQRVLLVHTKATKDLAELLANFIEDQLQIEVFKDDFIETDAFDLQLIQETAEKMFSALGSPENLLLNYTGGTKQMSIGFYQVAHHKNVQSVYTDSENTQFYYYKDFRIEKIAFDFEHKPLDNLSLREAKIVSKKSIKQENPLFKLANYLFQNRSNTKNKVYEKVIKVAVRCKKDNDLNYEPNFSDSQLQVSYAFNQMSEKTILVVFDDIPFKNHDLKFWITFFSGAWFEYWTASVLFQTGNYTDMLMNVKIAPNIVVSNRMYDETLKNEIDILTLYDYFPFIFECKAGSVKKADITNLQSTSSYFFPKYQQAVLVSYFPIAPELKEKCDDYGILVLQGKEKLLKELSDLKRGSLIKL